MTDVFKLYKHWSDESNARWKRTRPFVKPRHRADYYVPTHIPPVVGGRAKNVAERLINVWLLDKPKRKGVTVI